MDRMFVYAIVMGVFAGISGVIATALRGTLEPRIKAWLLKAKASPQEKTASPELDTSELVMARETPSFDELNAHLPEDADLASQAALRAAMMADEGAFAADEPFIETKPVSAPKQRSARAPRSTENAVSASRVEPFAVLSGDSQNDAFLRSVMAFEPTMVVSRDATVPSAEEPVTRPSAGRFEEPACNTYDPPEEFDRGCRFDVDALSAEFSRSFEPAPQHS